MPTPSKQEKKTQFISRCIKQVIGEGKSQDQASAICFSIWENKSKGGFIELSDKEIIKAIHDKKTIKEKFIDALKDQIND